MEAAFKNLLAIWELYTHQGLTNHTTGATVPLNCLAVCMVSAEMLCLQAACIKHLYFT
jgi:hypothetical protein